MGDRSKIAWTDATWNPVVGCSKVSDGCAHCYAIEMAHKLGTSRGGGGFGRTAAYEGLTYTLPDGSHNWNGEVHFLPSRLEIPLRWGRPRRVFVNSMSDLFHPKLTPDEIARVFAVMALATRHQFQVLTKRPWGMKTLLSDPEFWIEVEGFAAESSLANGILRDSETDQAIGTGVLPNVWLGTSVEHQEAADERVPHLLKTPAAIRFLSCEPLLGPVELSDVTHRADAAERLGRGALEGIHWVIAGGESGPGFRPMDPDWARSLRDQCRAAGVAFFLKQGAGPRPGMHRELDGRLWEQFPEARVAAEA